MYRLYSQQNKPITCGNLEIQRQGWIQNSFSGQKLYRMQIPSKWSANLNCREIIQIPSLDVRPSLHSNLVPTPCS